MRNNKFTLLENIEQIRTQANIIEEQAKVKEHYLLLNGGAEKNPELGEDVSNMLLDSIKAKLIILDQISNQK